MKISTIIPAYNRATLIPATLESILGQTRPPDEIIVVDDGSTDDTASTVLKYSASVKLLRQPNSGAGAARNLGFLHSKGDIIHFMDSDDISSLNTYAVQGAAIEAGADIVYGPWIRTRFNGVALDPDPCALQQAPVPGTRPLDWLVLAGVWVTVLQPCMFRRTLIESAGLYRTDLSPSEDTEMLYRLTKGARSVKHTDETLLLYRVHGNDQISVKNPEKRTRDWEKLCQILKDHASARPDIDSWTRRRARLSHLRAALNLKQLDPNNPLYGSIQPKALDHARLAMASLAKRVDAKVRHMMVGDRSNRYFAPGPLSPDQKRQIASLGYKT